VISVAVDHSTLDFGSVMPGTTPNPLAEDVTVTSTDSSGYTLTVDRSAFTPHDLPLGVAVGTNALAAVPIAPAPSLLLGTTSSASAPAGDVWATNVGFVSPLPALPSGHYTATLTYTVIAQ
jgi:hypothetical protein